MLTDHPSKAHILPNALGGSLYSWDIECEVCNPGLSPVEDRLIQDYRAISGPLGIVRGDRDPGAPHIVEVAGEKHHFYGGLLDPISRRGKERKREGGGHEFHLRGRTADDFARNIVDILRQKRLTPEEWERSMPGGFRLSMSHGEKVDAGEAVIKIGGEIQERAIVKMLLGLVGKHAPDLARSPQLSHARAFVKEGGRNLSDHLQVGPCIAAREAAFVQSGSLPPFAHVLEIWTVPNALLGRVLLFGHFPFVVLLCNPWTERPFSTSYIADPTTGRQIGRSQPGQLLIPVPAWWLKRSRLTEEEGRRLSEDALQALHNHWARTIGERKRKAAMKLETFNEEDVLRRVKELYARRLAKDKRRR